MARPYCHVCFVFVNKIRVPAKVCFCGRRNGTGEKQAFSGEGNVVGVGCRDVEKADRRVSLFLCVHFHESAERKKMPITT